MPLQAQHGLDLTPSLQFDALAPYAVEKTNATSFPTSRRVGRGSMKIEIAQEVVLPGST